MFSQKMFRIKGNITLDKLFFCSNEEDFSFFQMEIIDFSTIQKILKEIVII